MFELCRVKNKPVRLRSPRHQALKPWRRPTNRVDSPWTSWRLPTVLPHSALAHPALHCFHSSRMVLTMKRSAAASSLATFVHHPRKSTNQLIRPKTVGFYRNKVKNNTGASASSNTNDDDPGTSGSRLQTADRSGSTSTARYRGRCRCNARTEQRFVRGAVHKERKRRHRDSYGSRLDEPLDTVLHHLFTIQIKGFSLCFRSHQMLIGLLRSRHGSWTVPGDVRELLDLGK